MPQRSCPIWSIEQNLSQSIGWNRARIKFLARFLVAIITVKTVCLTQIAVDRALETATPNIWNSDQGSHFTSPQYLERLLHKGVRISMDGKGRALDNVFVERLWRAVKYEEVYLHDYDSPRAARHGLGRYLTFYNKERLHQSLGYRTPAQVYHPG